eukprot:3571359-Rhodomonas_salina.2
MRSGVRSAYAHSKLAGEMIPERWQRDEDRRGKFFLRQDGHCQFRASRARKSRGSWDATSGKPIDGISHMSVGISG